MKLKDLLEKYGEYEIDSTSSFGKCGEVESITISLTKPEPKTVWDLEYGERYFAVYPTGEIGDIKFSDCQNDCCVVANGNAFLTEEEAKREAERRKVETLMLKHGGRRWFNNKGDNWYVVRENNDLETYQAYCILPLGAIYFDTEEQAEKAIEKIGKERIINALFEVR